MSLQTPWHILWGLVILQAPHSAIFFQPLLQLFSVVVFSKDIHLL